MGHEVLPLYRVVAGRPVVSPLTYDLFLVDQDAIERYHILSGWCVETGTLRRK